MLSVHYGVLKSELLEPQTVSGQANEDSSEKKNIVRIAGRDGSYVEKKLSDEQVAALKTLIDQLPEADDL